MARTTVKSTYALDVETVRALDHMARRLGVSKSEALRRAIRTAAGEQHGQGSAALAAFDRLQRSLRLTPAGARAWASRVRTERRASSTPQSNRER